MSRRSRHLKLLSRESTSTKVLFVRKFNYMKLSTFGYVSNVSEICLRRRLTQLMKSCQKRTQTRQRGRHGGGNLKIGRQIRRKTGKFRKFSAIACRSLAGLSSFWRRMKFQRIRDDTDINHVDI